MTKKLQAISFCQGKYLGSTKFFSEAKNMWFRKSAIQLDDVDDIIEAYADNVDATMPALNSTVTLRKYNESYTLYL
jgi:hypothetical protein